MERVRLVAGGRVADLPHSSRRCRRCWALGVHLLGVICLVGGCIGEPREPRLSGGASEERLTAAARLGQSDLESASALIDMLESADAAERMVAIGRLEEFYGERKGFDPTAPVGERLASVEKWRLWLAEARPRGNDLRPAGSGPAPKQAGR